MPLTDEKPFLRSALAPEDVALLRLLNENDGYTLGVRCLYAGLPNDRRGLAAAHRRMCHMEREGMVRPLDDQRPIIWLRTAKGTAELAARDAEGDA